MAQTQITDKNLADTGTMPAWDGSALTGISGGKVLQVAYTTSTFGTTTASSSNGVYVDTTVNITFTPTTTASKFLVFFRIGAVVQSDPDDFGWSYRIKKTQSSTDTNPSGLDEWLGSGGNHAHKYIYESAITNWNNYQQADNFWGIDVDAHTTASITYTVQLAQTNAGTNLRVGNENNVRPQMIVQEIA